MERTAFQEKELEVREWHHCGGVQMMNNMGIMDFPNVEPLFDRPITEKENFRLWFTEQKPYWLPAAGWVMCDVNVFRPRMNPDNVACRIIFDGEPLYEYDDFTMQSWFDLDWVYVPVAGGSTVKPGVPKIEDMNDWKEILTFPNLDDLDWEGCAAANREYLNTSQMNQLGILCGFWERLISLMDVDGAAIAMIDEDQQDAVKEFFDAYADFLIDYIDRMKKYCAIDNVLIHDDWGHQNGGFFSLDTAREMLVPYLKKITDAVHERGMTFELHSCGKNEALVPAYIEAGVDLWCPQTLNDVKMLGEQYQDQPITFGMTAIEMAPDASEQEQEEVAKKWFETYKDYRVIPAFVNGTPIVWATLYRLSREYYMD